MVLTRCYNALKPMYHLQIIRLLMYPSLKDETLK